METIYIRGGIPFRLKKASIPNPSAALNRLQSFVSAKEPRLAQFVHSFIVDQGDSITYKTLREAILGGELPKEVIESWQQAYSGFVFDKMLPQWEQAFEAAAQEIADKYPTYYFDSTAVGVRTWNITNAARFVTNCTNEQINGLRAVIRRATELADNGMNTDELARVIRPMVGLTERQTRANINYYEKLIANGMSKEKARERAIKYSARQHRYRAQMIARTELAFSYNHGKYNAVLQAQEQGLMGKCIKRWNMADTDSTCEYCRSLDGKEIEMDEDFNIQTRLTAVNVKKVPPAHPHCMCEIDYIEIEPPAADPGAQVGTETAEPQTEEELFPFTPAKTIKEANEYARDVLGIPNVDYKGTSVEIANEWNRGLADNFSRFPELRDNFDFVGTCQNRNKLAKKTLYPTVMDKFKRLNPTFTEKQLEGAVKRYITKQYAPPIQSSVYAQSCRTMTVRGITVNNRWTAEMLEESLKRDALSQFHPIGCDTIRSILDHEIGHQIDDMLDLCTKKVLVAYHQSLTNAEISAELSRYAWRNSSPAPIREFIAEAWSEYVNNPEPRRIAKTVGEFIEEEYAKYKQRNGG